MNTDRNEAVQSYVCSVTCNRCTGEPAGYIGDGFDYPVSPEGFNRCFTCPECEYLRESNRSRLLRRRGETISVCYECYEEASNIRWREYRDTESLRESEAGSIVKSKRLFGIELEVTYKREDVYNASKLSGDLPRFVGVGGDGSVSGLGMELVTPPAAGKKAEDLITDVCRSLKQYEASVNSSCGFHIHIDVADIDAGATDSLKLRKVKDLWLFYIAFEDVILSFLPTSRRDNRYCRTLRSDYHFSEIEDTSRLEQLERIWYRVRNRADLSQAKDEPKHDSRYRGINMHTLFSGRHLEIRFHAGTTNRRKVLEWANLHTAIVDRAFNRGFSPADLKDYLVITDLARKTTAMLNLLKLDKSSEDFFLARQSHFIEKQQAANSSAKERKERIDGEVLREAVGGITEENEN